MPTPRTTSRCGVVELPLPRDWEAGDVAGLAELHRDRLEVVVEEVRVCVEGAADGVFEVTYGGGSGTNSQILLMLRITTASNKWILRKRVGGADTTIGTTAVSATPGQRIRVVLAGASVKVDIDGVLLIDVLETDQQTGIRYGFGAACAANATPVALWDDISFVIPDRDALATHVSFKIPGGLMMHATVTTEWVRLPGWLLRIAKACGATTLELTEELRPPAGNENTGDGGDRQPDEG